MESAGILILLIVSISTFSSSYAYRFQCIGRGTCICDTDEQLIDCHNKRLEFFPWVSSKLPGYTILSLVNNKIKGPYPTESELLSLIPDLKLIDLTGNLDLDCRQLNANFPNLTIFSTCLATKDQISIKTHIGNGKDYKATYGPKNPNAIPDRPESSGNECDFWCEIEQKLTPAALEVYVHLRTAWLAVKTEVPKGLNVAANFVKNGAEDAYHEVKTFFEKLFG